MDIGKHLRECREREGITLRQIADSTKLSTVTLQYIERNQFDRLPGGIFTRGYLRAFAAEIGLNPEEIVAEYAVQFPAPSAAEEQPAMRATPIREWLAERRLSWAVVAIVLALAFYGMFRHSAESAPAPPLRPIEATPILSMFTEGLASDAPPAAERQDESVHLDLELPGGC
jgi:cytoskeleton protein RodZ